MPANSHSDVLRLLRELPDLPLTGVQGGQEGGSGAKELITKPEALTTEFDLQNLQGGSREQLPSAIL